MAFIYENDVTRLGGNLQTTVAYLLSLHKAEYEWNLLGIKVVGHVDALPIPDGTYEYGDAYTVGTAAPYDMWIYTRADEFHSSAYWFNIGKFPAPGPQGPKGDGFETVVNWNTGTVQSVTYDTDTGATIETTAEIQYKDSTTGETKRKTFPCTIKLPLIPGKYIGIDANSDGDAIKVKVDDTELGLDFYKVNKTDIATVPAYSPTAGRTNIQYSFGANMNSLVRRGVEAEVEFNYFRANRWENLTRHEERVYFAYLYKQCGSGQGAIGVLETPTDTGTITSAILQQIRDMPWLTIAYRNQTYYRMDPPSAPDGTLNYIHIDSIQDGNGGYKATGKCFSITVSTRAWQVVDVNFRDKIYQHSIYFELTGAGTTSDRQVWGIQLVITTSSPQKITKQTLYKYISTSNYPLIGGTPISVYRAKVQGPQGLGAGKMSVRHETGEISDTDYYYFEVMSMDGISETIVEKDPGSFDPFVDTVTEV